MNEDITKVTEIYDPVLDKMVSFDYIEELNKNGMLTIWRDGGFVTLYKEPIRGIKIETLPKTN
jgi:hypothetical protein